MDPRPFLIFLLPIISLPLNAAEHHVSPHGDDHASGSASSPWQNPTEAVKRLQAGDTLVFADGTYVLTGPIIIKVGLGGGERWTTLTAAPGARPVLDATGYNWPRDQSRGEFGMLQIQASSHVRLIGLTIKNSPAGSFSAHAPSHHLELLGCQVDGSAQFGIGLWDVQYVRVLGCEVNRANFAQRQPNGSATGKDRSAQEALSLGNVQHFEVAWNLVHHGAKEGIDIKRPSQDGRVHHNLIHHMSRQGLYLDSRRVGVLRNVEVDHNISHDNGWGLAFSGEQATAEMENIFAHHNLLYANRGSGLIIAPWVEDGPRRRLRLTHNTLVGNGTADQHWAGTVGNLDVRTTNLRDILIEANLCHDGGGFDLATAFPPKKIAEALELQRITIHRNRATPATSWPTTKSGQFARPHPYDGTGPVTDEPQFVNAAAGDFRLTEQNPAELKATGAFSGETADWARDVRTHAGRWPGPATAASATPSSP